MIREAILHIPLSNYAYGTDETHIVFRLRAARGDLISCILHYGDRSCRQTPVIFSAVSMQVAASDSLFDYFEIHLESPYTRVCYYFEINDGNETLLYYSGLFLKELTDNRSEYYQFPFNRREDITVLPDWVNDAVIYNIFPDSFATGRRYISGKGSQAEFNGQITLGKNGGTINGILKNLDYILKLGVNCIYLNPIFVAGEYHKYDLIDYFHVDPCFGTDEDFKNLVNQCHKKGIRTIIDGVFNHCGWNFFAFDDVVNNGEASKYKDWFYDLKFPVIRPYNMEDYPSYSCFGYERKMPKLNTSNQEVINYFQNVCCYWLKEFDIDGWRLDAANEINFDFWRTFRKSAKSIKPDCILIGEVWESALPWLRGDQFDSSMNYDFRKNCRDFFALGKIDSFGFESRVTDMCMRYPENILSGQLNLLDTHDVCRFLSLCNGSLERMRLAIVFQMTFPGIPSVLYGDELGTEGISEDEYRQSMPWQRETNSDMLGFYKKLISLRRSSNALKRGSIHTVYAEKGSFLYCFSREFGSENIMVMLNAGKRKEKIEHLIKGTEYLRLYSEGISGGEIAPWGFSIYSKA